MPVYLDHAATTTLAPEALAALTRELARTGNPSSLHGSGRRARRAVEDAREVLAAAAGAHPSEVIFTSGGTEADNLAVKGLYWARHAEDPARTRILCSAVEHHAVLDTVEWLERHEGAEVSWLPVDADGVVDLAVLAAELSRDPASIALVTVMWANNEVGSIQPVAEIVELAHRAGVPVHSDAVQAFGSVPVDFRATRAGRHVHLRAQDRRPGRRRGADARPRREADPGPARRGTGARRPLRNPGHRLHCSLCRGGRGGHHQTSGGSGNALPRSGTG